MGTIGIIIMASSVLGMLIFAIYDFMKFDKPNIK